MKMPKQAYTTEFKELAVKRIKDGQSVSKVCKELGLSDQTQRGENLRHFFAGNRGEKGFFYSFNV